MRRGGLQPKEPDEDYVTLFSKLALCLLLATFTVSVGCNSKPDPRDNPDFNEASAEDPMAIEMP